MANNRALNVNNLLQKKFNTYAFDGVFKDVFDTPEINKLWLIYGEEKNGKTTFALLLAQYLSQFEKVLFVSAEEGFSRSFIGALKRAKISKNNKSLQFIDYEEIDDLDERLSKRRAPKIVFLDNLTKYETELRKQRLRQFMDDHCNKTLIFIAHEDRNEPVPAAAKFVKKMAEIIIRVSGLSGVVSGRCPGGILMIDEDRAKLIHGTGALEKAKKA